MINVEMIPIKTLSLDKNWAYNDRQGSSLKNQKHKNSKNFMFMRMTNHSKKKSYDETNKIKNDSHTLNKNKRHEMRPKTSLLIQRKTEELNKKSFILIPKQNPQCTTHIQQRITKRYYTPTSEVQGEGYKNYFPQRKPKKNRDQKWHDYYTLLSIKQFTINYSEPSPAQLHKQRELAKTLHKTMRTKTPLPEYRRFKIKQKKLNSQRQLTTEISPWNTEGGDKIHHQHKLI